MSYSSRELTFISLFLPPKFLKLFTTLSKHCSHFRTVLSVSGVNMLCFSLLVFLTQLLPSSPLVPLLTPWCWFCGAGARGTRNRGASLTKGLWLWKPLPLLVIGASCYHRSQSQSSVRQTDLICDFIFSRLFGGPLSRSTASTFPVHKAISYVVL